MKFHWSSSLICNAIPKTERCCCCLSHHFGGCVIAFVYILVAAVNIGLVAYFTTSVMDKSEKLNYAFVFFAFLEDVFDVWLAVLLLCGIWFNSQRTVLLHQWLRVSQMVLFLISFLMGIFIVKPYHLVYGFIYAFQFCFSVFLWFQTNSIFREIYDDGRVISTISRYSPPKPP